MKVGTISLSCTCDVTDPCYNADVWCRHTVNVKPGVYNCYLEINEDDVWGNRVCSSWIIHEDYDNGEGDFEGLTFNFLEECGVDAGLLGYFDEKPDFTKEEWLDVCNSIDWESKYVIDKYHGRDGFFTESGYGDGCYDVSVYCKSGENVAIETIFFMP